MTFPHIYAGATFPPSLRWLGSAGRFNNHFGLGRESSLLSRLELILPSNGLGLDYFDHIRSCGRGFVATVRTFPRLMPTLYIRVEGSFLRPNCRDGSCTSHVALLGLRATSLL